MRRPPNMLKNAVLIVWCHILHSAAMKRLASLFHNLIDAKQVEVTVYDSRTQVIVLFNSKQNMVEKRWISTSIQFRRPASHFTSINIERVFVCCLKMRRAMWKWAKTQIFYCISIKWDWRNISSLFDNSKHLFFHLVPARNVQFTVFLSGDAFE